MNAFKPCIIIPNYNHAQGFDALVARLLVHGLPVIVINDGSNAGTTLVLQQLDRTHPGVEVLHSAANQGKGAAVMTGLRRSAERGFSHALQIDADGQHDLNDLDAFLALARQHPEAAICGCPVFDGSVPLGRKLARYLTHVCVWLETLSLQIRDSMCGFRVYPLDATLRVLDQHDVGKRMDFDIEILVRLYWDNVPVIPKNTRVIYPVDGLSNFRLWQDNWLITRMHVRLIAGMLMRSPQLLRRAAGSRGKLHWASMAERGSSSGLRLMLWVYRHLGRWVFLLLLHPVTLYFLLTAGTARRASGQYLRQLAAYQGKVAEPGLARSYAHFYAFGVAAIDKIASWTGAIKRSDVIVHGEEHFNAVLASGYGAIFIGSHLGNLELCRALGEKSGRFRINAVVFNKHAVKFHEALLRSCPDVELNLIHVENVGIETAVLLKQKVDAGEIVIIVGDRTSINNAGRVCEADFLGKPAPFGEGPFILAGVLDCPVYLIFCIREEHTYHVYLEPFAKTLKSPRAQRAQWLATHVQAYASRLAHHCTRAPLQWFNFYDFWQQDSAVERRQTAALNGNQAPREPSMHESHNING